MAFEDKNKTIKYPEGSYGGEALDYILQYTYQENEMYQHGLVHVQTGVTYQLKLPRSRSGRVIQDAQSTPTVESGRANANGFNSYEITERVLKPEHFGIFKLWDPEVMAQYWKQFAPLGTQVFRELSPKIQADFINQLIIEKNAEIGEALWLGVRGGVSTLTGFTQPTGMAKIGVTPDNMPQATLNTKFDGLIGCAVRSLKDTNPLDRVNVTGTAKLDTGEAVEKALDTMYMSIPSAMRTKTGKLSFLMHFDQWIMYDRYLSNKTYKNTDNSVENVRKYKGIRIIPIGACPQHTIVLGEFASDITSNFWVAIDWANPKDEDMVVINRYMNSSSEWFVKMTMKMDSNIVKPNEMWFHSPYFEGLVTPPSTGEEGEG